jgi:hypothetical protein
MFPGILDLLECFLAMFDLRGCHLMSVSLVLMV